MLTNDSESISEENELLREEVQVTRKASDITAQLVVEQFVQIEKMLKQLEESEQRYRSLYQEAIQREQLYRSLLNSTPDAVMIFDPDLNPIYVNPAFVRVFGVTLEDIQSGAVQFVPADETEKYRQVMAQIAAGEPISSLQTRRQEKNGRILNISLSASRYYDQEGNLGGVMMILRDITERKQGEVLLQKQKEMFFNILQAAPYGVALLGQNDRILYLNPEFTKTLGYTLEDIPTLSEWFLHAFEVPEKGRDVMRTWLDEKTPVGKEKVCKIHCKSGDNKEIEFRCNVLDDGRILVTLTDVTARTQTEECIRRAKKQWERTFDAIEDVITIQDSEMRVLRVNRAAARALGKEPGELIGKYCYELFAQQSEPCEGCPYHLTIKDHAPHSNEVEQPQLQKICLVMTAPIFDESGQFTGIVHSARDITEKRKIEEELVRAQKLESIGILAGGIAHDFNNILTAILGNISLAKMESTQQGDALARLEEAEKATLRARDLTHQLLTFSKGGAPLKKAASIVQLIRESASFALTGSNVRCDYDMPEDLWSAAIDQGQISQVINNLIINSCQAMPEGGKIEIGARNVLVEACHKLPLKPGRYIKVSVTDHGTGIRPQNMAKVFDPYFSTKPQGNGLGLATAYSIIKRHEGHITVDSIWRHGATFDIYLPAAHEQCRMESIPDDNFLPSSGKGKTLVMDDEKAIRDLAGQMLRLLGYQVEFAKDGDEAIRLYRQARESGSPFDVVLMDLTIPGGMGGKETIKRLKEIDPETKAVVSSGYYTDPIMSNFKESGFSGVIAKPYRLQELGEVLHNLISGTRD